MASLPAISLLALVPFAWASYSASPASSVTRAPSSITRTVPSSLTRSASTCQSSICADYINSCGIPYGGCYPVCSGYTTPTFTPPPCPRTTTTSCTTSICTDYTDSRGIAYGGCYPACSGYTTPTFTDPGCATTLTPRPSCTTTICADYVNSCGQTYGGCYPACSGYTTPSFTDPGCPITTTTSGTITTSSTCGLVCDDYVDRCGNTYGPGCYPSCSPRPTFTTPSCSVRVTTTTYRVSSPSAITIPGSVSPSSSCGLICRDYFDDCGNTYGPGCYPSCSTVPSFTTPSCSLTLTTTTTSSLSSSSVCGLICQDYFDDCGNTYGPGCYPSCSPAPTYTTPSCSSGTTVVTPPPYVKARATDA